MSAPSVPAFLFEGDTFAVPSWEFRCDLPPEIPRDYEPAPPHTTAPLFGVTWEIFRSYRGRWMDGVLFMDAYGDGIHLRTDGYGGPVFGVGGVRTPEVTPINGSRTLLSPDEFMHALKAIAERNGE